MEKHFMLDIEATGIEPDQEDLLQVGMLEVDFRDGFWRPGRTYEMLHQTKRKPTTEFAKQHQLELYARCNAAPMIPIHVSRDTILSFFKECGVEPPDVYFMGWNASNYDVPFLTYQGHLKPSRYVTLADGTDRRVGDFHYRIYEMGGAIAVVENALLFGDRKKLIEVATELGHEVVPFDLPPGVAEHDALYDCFKQLRTLNGLIEMARSGRG